MRVAPAAGRIALDVPEPGLQETVSRKATGRCCRWGPTRTQVLLVPLSRQVKVQFVMNAILHMRVGWLARVAMVAAILVVGGCSEKVTDCHIKPYTAATPVGELYTYCFSGTDRSGELVSALLYLDTINLPSNNMGIATLVLSSLPTDPGAGADRLEYHFADSLSASIDPGILREFGWKVRIPAATIQYCQSCFTDCGLAPVIYVVGLVGSVEFVYDPGDTAEVFIQCLGS